MLHVPDVNVSRASPVEELDDVEYVTLSKCLVEDVFENLVEPLVRNFALIKQVVAF